MTTTRISCREYSFPAVPGQRERIGMVRLLGFELVDIALFRADGAELVVAGLTDEEGRLVRYEEDWHLD